MYVFIQCLHLNKNVSQGQFFAAGMDSEFSFSKTGFHAKAKEPSLFPQPLHYEQDVTQGQFLSKVKKKKKKKKKKKEDKLPHPSPFENVISPYLRKYKWKSKNTDELRIQIWSRCK